MSNFFIDEDAENMHKMTAAEWLLSIQHLFAMFGATVLVPLLTGMNASAALVSAGIGTLIFHACTKFRVPVFLGSSFAFIPALAAIVIPDGKTIVPGNVPIAQGGIIAAGLVYAALAIIVYFAGADRIKALFPPVVTGPVIVVIGISLAPVAINDATGWANLSEAITSATLINIGIAMFTLAIVVVCSVLEKGFFKLVPILIGIGAGYLLSAGLMAAGVLPKEFINFAVFADATWINIPFQTVDANGVQFFTIPKFDLGAIVSIAPIALVTFMEHIGDITTNSAVVGKDFMKNPGLHRTLLGDGIATSFAGLIGGPPNTTYSENTGVLATTKNYNPRLLRVTAVFAVLLGVIGPFGAFLQTIPSPVKGGVEMVLFGMIAAIGIRTLAEAELDFTHSRNLIIVALILVFGLGIAALGNKVVVSFGGENPFVMSGLFLAVIVGVVANLVLPKNME